ncbi:MAG: DHHA1 domain-containing protein [Candidatus Korarchaeota archaeon]|nr:DHHA1 domain-containing protein [Candidatus Korarchaeota archaeon]
MPPRGVEILDWLTSSVDPPYSVLSHGEDLDGLASAALIYAALGGEVSMRFEIPDRAQRSRKSFHVVADLPPPAGGSLILFDHHRSNVDLARERAEVVILDPRAPSAASVIWREFAGRIDVPELGGLVELTSRVDSGDMGFCAAAFTSAVKRIFWTGKRDRVLNSIVRSLLELRPEREEELLEIPEVKRAWAEVERVNSEEIGWISSLPSRVGDAGPAGLVAVVDARRIPGYLSPLIHQALRDRVDLIVTLGRWRGNDSRVSLRSRRGGPIDALEIARSFGGGGHPNAAGFTLLERELPRLLELVRRRSKRVVFLRP